MQVMDLSENCLETLANLMFFITFFILGHVKICAFDKTGTLTSDNMKICSIVLLPPKDDTREIVKKAICNRDTVSLLAAQKNYEIPFSTSAILAACHSLVSLPDKKLVGDPVEISSMTYTGPWILKDSKT
jgi:manganese-transporting P-type ATPase